MSLIGLIYHFRAGRELGVRTTDLARRGGPRLGRAAAGYVPELVAPLWRRSVSYL